MGQNKEAFRALTKDDILNPFISEHDFKSSNDQNSVGYFLYVFDMRHQKVLESAQPFKVEFKFYENLTAGIYGFALVLTNRLSSKSSDGQRPFDLISVIFNFFITSFFSFIVNSVFYSKNSLYLSDKLSM